MYTIGGGRIHNLYIYYSVIDSKWRITIERKNVDKIFISWC